MAMALFEEMEKAACCLLQIIKDTPELGKATKVAIAGSMAMQRHLPQYMPDGAAVSSIFFFLRKTRLFPLRHRGLTHVAAKHRPHNQLHDLSLPATEEAAAAPHVTLGGIKPASLLPPVRSDDPFTVCAHTGHRGSHHS